MNEELITRQEIKLSELVYNALPIGNFYDPRYWKVEITPALISKMADNFGKFPTYELPVKLGHSDGAPAVGKIKSVEARADGLYLSMDIDEKSRADIEAGRYKYMSAEYSGDYMDKATGESVGAVLRGVALVNQPGHPGVRPIVFSDGEWHIEKTQKGGNKNMTLDELTKKVEELEAEKAGLKKAVETAEAEAKASKEFSDATLAANAKLTAEKRAADVKLFCDDWAKKGIAPAVLEKVKPLLFCEQIAEVKLSDTETVSAQKMFADIFEAMPKISMSAAGDPNATGSGNAEFALGDAIAKIANA